MGANTLVSVGALLRCLPLLFLSLFTLDLFHHCNAAAVLPRELSSRDASETTILTDVLPAADLALALNRRQSSNGGYPTAFDSSIGNNFTQQSCPNFFNTFLNDPSFVACHPVSMMLQTSNSFFQALKSQVLLTRTLDAACSANAAVCAPLMTSYASKLQSQCSNDYKLGNPLVTMAYAGFRAYSPLYEATCLRSQNNGTATGKNSTSATSTSNYCFASAATNASNPTGVYVYYLPLGIDLPGGASMGCNSCLQQTMNGFSKYAANSSQPLSKTYKDAATLVNEVCGPSWVSADVQQAKSAAHTISINSWSLLAALAVALALLQ